MTTVILLTVTGLVSGLAIGIVVKFYGTTPNPLEEKLLELVPGANCGGCGFAGCEGYAKAMAEGSAKPGACPLMNDAVVQEICALLGVESEARKPMVAIVCCSGDDDHAQRMAFYNGVNDCQNAMLVAGGGKGCVYGCLGLGSCARACPYGAIDYTKGLAAEVITAKCHGCGACVGECPHDSITQLHYTDAQVLAQIRTLLAVEPEKKILAFRCQWCSYGGADLAGTSHFEYSANERGLRVMCSARMDADLIYEAYRLGAGAILYSGCHPQDCHYITGQVVGAKRAARLEKIFERMQMSPGRFRVEWISAAEGDKYARVINEMQASLDAIPEDVLKAEIKRLRPEMAKKLTKLDEIPGVAQALVQVDFIVNEMVGKEKVA